MSVRSTFECQVTKANACRIFLNATNEQALSKVSMDELKQFAVDKET